MRRAFYLNLDADDELGALGRHQPKKEVLRSIQAMLPRLHALTQGEPILDFPVPQRWESRLADIALCWCPTERALSALGQAGWPVPKAPSARVLARVNDRRFVLDHRPASIERAWVDSGSDLSWLTSGERFRLKRPFGFAGRGQRTVGPVLSSDDRRWVEDSLANGFVREPELDITFEYCLHGLVDDAGVLLGTPCRQSSDRFGRVIAFEVVEAGFRFEPEMRTAATEIAAELQREGYFGPFGIDAFSYRDDRGEHFNALSELNARFTLAWSVGMGQRRELALRRLRR